MKERVCAVVVTYNRKQLLIECLEALKKQTRPLDGIHIIDNASTDETPEFLLSNGYIKELPPENLVEPWEKEFEVKSLTDGQLIKINYVRMHENTGGAGGFYEGVRRAYVKGYDWLWLMDDDAEPKEDALEKLSNCFDIKEISALACKVVFPNGKICFYHRGFINFKNIYPLLQKPLQKDKYRNQIEKIDIASFVGILIRRTAIEKIGFPKKEFFIHHDDVEYCLRLRKVGEILLISDSVIIHKEARKKGIRKKFFWKESIRIPYRKFWLTYYGRRNLVWLGKKYSTKKFNFWKGFVISLLKSMIGILFFDNHKFRRINFILNAYFDGLKENFDNEKPKRILYKKKNEIS
ncbi:glycosyltransferase family 2 protein [Thermotomaculum hydrothermale]|uniref:glycosyltransferase family 2 protein n=1 Tax=Thermotomaculum hydrothermale TaxID=981385 RepID=UPI0038B57A7B